MKRKKNDKTNNLLHFSEFISSASFAYSIDMDRYCFIYFVFSFSLSRRVFSSLLSYFVFFFCFCTFFYFYLSTHLYKVARLFVSLLFKRFLFYFINCWVLWESFLFFFFSRKTVNLHIFISYHLIVLELSIAQYAFRFHYLLFFYLSSQLISKY